MAYRANENGLTVRQEEFAKAIAIGLSQPAAYRKSFPHKGKSDSAIESAAHRVAIKPKVIARVESFRKEAKPSDMHTQGEWMADLLDGISQAKGMKNWTAYAALKRLSGQAVGTLNEVLTVRAEQSMSDETLVKQLGKADPSLVPGLRVLLGGKRNRGAVLDKPAAEGGV